MAYIPYPQAPGNPNGWQIAGAALQQGGQQLGAFEDQQQKLRQAMDEMTMKRVAAELAKRAAEDAHKEAERADAKEKTRLELEAKAEENRKKLAAGKTIPGKAVGGTIGEDEAVPYSPEEANRMLYSSGELSGKEFSATIDPAKSIEGQKEIFGFKDAATATREEKRQQYLMAMEEYKQGRMDYRTLMSLKAALAKTETPKDLQAGEIDKLTALGNKRSNVKYIADSFKDEYSGPGNGLQNAFGKLTGTSEDQVLWWQGYNSFVNEIRNDLFGASLTPGEKAEFEKTKINTLTAPSIVKKNLARQFQIVNDAVERQKRVHSAGRRVNTAQVEAALGDVQDAPAPSTKTTNPKAIFLKGDKARRLAELRKKAAQGSLQ